MKTTTAYAWASGLIEFTTPKRRKTVPCGALPIITGPDKVARGVIECMARLSYKGKPLVPGVPEADNQTEACNALIAFARECKKRLTRRIKS